MLALAGLRDRSSVWAGTLDVFRRVIDVLPIGNCAKRKLTRGTQPEPNLFAIVDEVTRGRCK